MDTYLARVDKKGLSTDHLEGKEASLPHGILLRQLLDTVEKMAGIKSEDSLTEIAFMGIVRLQEISQKLGETIALINPSSGKLNGINDAILKDYFGNLQSAIAFDNLTPLVFPPLNIVQGQNSIDTLMSQFRQGSLQKVDLKFTVESIPDNKYVDGTLLHDPTPRGMFLKLDQELFPIDSTRDLKQQFEEILSSVGVRGASMSTEITGQIENLAPITNTFNSESRGEWTGLLTKLSSKALLTPQDKTTLYMTAKTMAYYFPSIPPSKESLQKFVSFFQGTATLLRRRNT
jgi:hypothetical protein